MRRADNGATLVEASFALPILLIMLLGLVDIGMFALDSNRASNSARDGARVGIIDHAGADVVGSADYEAIKTAMQSNVPDRVVDDASLTVRCIDPSDVVVTCADAEVDVDRLDVTVAWQWGFINPIANLLGFDKGDVDGNARMVITGKPAGAVTVPSTNTTTTTTIPCAVAVSPDPVKLHPSKAGELQKDLDLVVTVGNGCEPTADSVVLRAPDGVSTATVCVSACTGTYTYAKNADTFWTAGTATADVIVSGIVVASTTFTVTS